MKSCTSSKGSLIKIENLNNIDDLKGIFMKNNYYYNNTSTQ